MVGRRFAYASSVVRPLQCCRDLRSRRTCRFERKGVEYNVTTLEVVQSFLTLTNKGTGFCYSWMWAPFADAKLEARTTAALRSEVPPDLLILNPGELP
jgi:hypothetical protein